MLSRWYHWKCPSELHQVLSLNNASEVIRLLPAPRAFRRVESATSRIVGLVGLPGCAAVWSEPVWGRNSPLTGNNIPGSGKEIGRTGKRTRVPDVLCSEAAQKPRHRGRLGATWRSGMIMTLEASGSLLCLRLDRKFGREADTHMVEKTSLLPSMESQSQMR